MPTGFDVETGSDLSERLKNCAPILMRFLKQLRQSNQRNENNPVTSSEIKSRFLELDNSRLLVGSEIRAMINHLRRMGFPIGSTHNSYFFALNREELRYTLQHMKERISGITGAINGLEHAFDQREETLF